MNFDGGQEAREFIGVVFSAKTASVTNANAVDVGAGESLRVIVVSGAYTSGGLTPTIEEGDASDFSDGAAVAAAQITATPLNTAGTLAGAKLTAANQVKSFGCITKKTRVKVGFIADASTDMVAGAIIVLGKLKEKAL